MQAFDTRGLITCTGKLALHTTCWAQQHSVLELKRFYELCKGTDIIDPQNCSHLMQSRLGFGFER